MPNEFTNLLPSERLRFLARDYYVRLAVVILWFVATLALSAVILLIPTYLLVSARALEKQAQFDAIAASGTSIDERALAARLDALATRSASIATLANQPSVSGIIQSILQVSRPGVTLSDFSYTPPGTLRVGGVAETRNALRKYQIALEEAKAVAAANLPVSAYAKDTDIPFTITVTLKP